MSGSRAAPLDKQSLSRGHEHRVAPLLETAEQRRHGHAERLRQPLQRRERGRGNTVLDFGQHAERKVGGPRKVRGGNAEFVAEAAHLAANGDFQHVVARALQRMGVLLTSEGDLLRRDVPGDAPRLGVYITEPRGSSLRASSWLSTARDFDAGFSRVVVFFIRLRLLQFF